MMTNFLKDAAKKLQNHHPARLFIIEFNLYSLSGHFFNQLLGFKYAAEEYNLSPYILVPKDTNPSLIKLLHAYPVIEWKPMEFGQFNYKLDILTESAKQLNSLWSTIEAADISNQDILLILSQTPELIYSLGVWFSKQESGKQPTVFIRFIQALDYFDSKSMGYNEKSYLYRFAAQDLFLRKGQEKIFFTANNEEDVILLKKLCGRRIFHMPLPKYYGEHFSETIQKIHNPTVYMHINSRCPLSNNSIKSIIRSILKKYPNTKFVLHFTSESKEKRTTELNPNFIIKGVEEVPSELFYTDYINVIQQSNIILLPHDPHYYKMNNSGVFAEGAAFGKVIIYPDDTWMSDQVSKGRAVGVSFKRAKKQDITAALLHTLAFLPMLSSEAKKISATFRKENNCKKHLDIMIDLSKQQHSMIPPYLLGNPIYFNKTLDSRPYMDYGWGETEPNGVWTVSSSAQLIFNFESNTTEPLLLEILLTPFLDKTSAQSVIITVNDVNLDEWGFPNPKEIYPAKRSLLIPPEVIQENSLSLRIAVKSPTSPQQLGLSQDPRLLGVMLHQLTISHPDVKPLFPPLLKAERTHRKWHQIDWKK